MVWPYHYRRWVPFRQPILEGLVRSLHGFPRWGLPFLSSEDHSMLKQLTQAAVVLSLSATILAQTPIVIPPHATVYNGYSRGWSMVSPTDFFIQSLELPLDAQQTGDTVSLVVLINGVQAFYSAGTTPAVTTCSPPPQVFTGDLVQVIGNWSPAAPAQFTAHNSYGSTGPFATTVLGQPAQLDRAGWQWDVGDTVGYVAAANFSGLTGSLGRIIANVTPPAGIFAGIGIDAASNPNGATPLTIDFTDQSFTDDPNGIALYEWDFENDGVVDSNAQNPTHTYTTCGVYDVTLTVTDGINGSNSTTAVGLIDTDQVVASFDVSSIAPTVWQFTDTSSPPATSWAWDFDNDGTVDDTTQNPVFVSTGNCLNLPSVSFTAGLSCNSDTLVGPVFAATNSAMGETGGGNGTASANGVGNYFDIQVTNPEGLNVCGVGVCPYNWSAIFDVEVYVTGGTSLGKEGVAAAWTLVGTGSGVGTGAAFTAPDVIGVGMDQSFYLPAGDYGVAVFLRDPLGASMNIAYTNGPALSPYNNADIVIHPNGVGSSSTSTLGPVSFTPRLFNGGFYYNLCSVTGEAASGAYGSGCVGSGGIPAGLTETSPPTLGGNYALDVTGITAPGIGLMVVGTDNTTYSGIPLPLDLGIVGAPGCQLLNNALNTSTLVAVGATAQWSIAVPANPALACFKIYNQAAILDVAANSLGFYFSGGRAAVLGN
jgi:PKD repeat protein